jgi:hypothetical protein
VEETGASRDGSLFLPPSRVTSARPRAGGGTLTNSGNPDLEFLDCGQRLVIQI